MRISKFIAHTGLCSRREAEKLIIDRKVKINEKLCEDLSYKVKEKDKVFVNGRKINLQGSVDLYILNKPRGYITSKVGQNQRKTVYDLLPKNKQNLITIGLSLIHI